MRIIFSPAKKMNVDTDKIECQGKEACTLGNRLDYCRSV